MKRTISVDTYMMMQATLRTINSEDFRSIRSTKKYVNEMLESNGVEVESAHVPTSTPVKNDCDSCKHKWVGAFCEKCLTCNEFDKWEQQ